MTNSNDTYFNFNRHELMSAEMVSAISTANRVFMFNDEIGNMVAGLFDGYYYYELPELLKVQFREMNSNKREWQEAEAIAIKSLLFVLSIVKTWEGNAISENEVHAINLM